MFLAGLLDWVGDGPPNATTIAGARVMQQGFAHVITIRKTGGVVLGRRSPEYWVPALSRSHQMGPDVWIYRGYTPVRPAERSDAALPVSGTWGYSVIGVLAEAIFVQGQTIP